MSCREDILNKIQGELPRLAQEYGVRKIGLFGSVARGVESPESDIDLLVEFSRPIGLQFVALVEELEQLTGRRVDLLTEKSIDTIRRPSIANSIKHDIIYA